MGALFNVVSVVGAALLFLPAFASCRGHGQATLSNDEIEVTFTPTCGISFLGRPPRSSGNTDNSTVDPAVAALIWSIQVVGSTIKGATTITATPATCRGVLLDGDRVIESHEAAVPTLRAIIGVTVVTQLLKDGSNSSAGLISSQLSVKLLRGNSGTIGLWLAGLSLSGVRTSPRSRNFLPRGFGVTDWAMTPSDLNYPDMSSDVGATMQFMSTEVPGTSSAIYVGTHDGSAHAKTLGSTTDIGTDADTLSLGYSLTPEGAADPALLAGNRTYTVPFPLVVGVLPGDGTEASWYSASQVYRSWVLAGAHWTKAGPIAHRTNPAVPAWLLHNDVWVNSGRSCANGSKPLRADQGDPAAVLAAVSQIATRFALPSLGHHWYTWECGTKSKDGCQDPNDPDRFKFDTQRPGLQNIGCRKRAAQSPLY